MIQNRSMKTIGCRGKAFTLIEMLVVLLIIGIFSTVAIAQYTQAMVRQRLAGAANRIRSDISFARHQARFTSLSKSITFDIRTNTYTIDGVFDPDHPQQPYQVSLSELPYGAEIVSADLGGDPKIVFNGYGEPDSNGTVVVRIGNLQKVVIISGPLISPDKLIVK